MTTNQIDHNQTNYAAQAQCAIEIVCSGDLSRIAECYHPDFVDHVNDMTFHGHEGARESVGFYLALLKDLKIGVDEQITEGDRVASRWTVGGSYHGRTVTLRGITISCFAEDGRTIEDRGYTDSLSLPRQLGVLRSLILGVEILTRRVKLPKGTLRAAH
jgi:ketosteroid isomerase-like protein